MRTHAMATNDSVTAGAPHGRGLRLLIGAGAAVLLAGCASFSPDGGFSAVEQTTRDRIGKDVRWVRSESDQAAVDQRVSELLGKPLSIEDAVQLALLNNRGLQASFHDFAGPWEPPASSPRPVSRRPPARS